MSRFVLTAQLQLQAPTNVGQVVRQIQSQLNGVQVNVQVQGAQQAQRQVNQLAAATNNATGAAERLGRTFGVSIKRFAALAVATRAVSLFTNSLSKSIEEAISFERELIKISQVTGKTVSQLRDLTNEITRLSTGLGVSSTSLINVSRILSQAGFDARQTKIALDALAKTELAPTFEDITETAEGAVAIFNQFQQGAEALEAQLGSINAVAGRFAVESGDLIGVVRRVGGVFRASGGDLNELIALFTSVRATTRESAESIATGLRTIFTRIQRPKTIEFLKQYGVQLVDLEGKFVGPFEAVKRLSEALAGLEQGDITFIRIAEELGGFRQIGKVIPLLQQFRVAQEALNVAQEGSGSLAKDAATAQEALAVRIVKVKEKFLALIRSITETTAFQLFANTALNLAEALIKLADALKPIIPLLAAVAGFRLATGLSGFLKGVRGGVGSARTFNQGGRVLKFARGGMVPGTGNRDTVPAMLQPGEFVIRKSSVNKLGSSNLAAMNENRYNRGTQGRGIVGATKQLKSVQKRKDDFSPKQPSPGSGFLRFNVNEGQIGAFVLQPTKGTEGFYKPNKATNFELPPSNRYAQLAAKQAGLDPESDISGNIKAVLNPGSYPVFYPGMIEGRSNLEKNAKYSAAVTKGFNDAVSAGVNSTIQSVISQKLLDIPPSYNTDENLLKSTISSIQADNQVRSSIEGYLFEGMISAFTGAKAAGGTSSFDFPRSAISQNKDKLSTLFGSPQMINKLIKAEAKRSYGEVGKVTDKLVNDIKANKKGGVSIQTAGKKFAKGGKALIQKGQQLGGVGIFDSDKIPGGTNVKKALLEQIKASKKPYQVISGPAGSGKTTFAASRFGNNFILSAADLAKYSRFVVLSGAGKTKTGDFSDDVKSLLSGASNITVLSPDQERLMKQRQGRLDSAISGNLPDERSVGALQGTLKAPTDTNEELFRRYANVEILQRYAKGGGVGTDTVPALLTPGEFVINKKSAQAIGYGSLNRMNKVGKYANGGVVQKFAIGGSVTSKSVASKVSGLADNRVLQNEIVATAQEIKKTGSYAKILTQSIDKQSKVTNALYQESAILDAKIKRYAAELDRLAVQQGKAVATGTAANRIVQLRAAAEAKRVEIDNKAIAEDQKLEGIKKKYSATIEKQTQLTEKQNALIQQAKSNKQAATQLVQSNLVGGKQSNFSQFDTEATRQQAYAQARSRNYARQDADNQARKSTGLLTRFRGSGAAGGGGRPPSRSGRSGGGVAMSGGDIGMMAVGLTSVTAALQSMLPPLDENSSAFTKLAHSSLSLVTQIGAAVFALNSFGISLNKQSAMNFLSGKGLSVGGKRGVLSAAQNLGFSRNSSVTIMNSVNAISKLAGPILAVVGASLAAASAFRTIYDSIYDFDNRLKKSIEKGDIEGAKGVAAEKAAANNNLFSGKNLGTVAASTAAGAAVGSFIPVIGTVVGGLIGFGVGLAVVASGMTTTSESAIALAASQAGAVKTQKDLVKAQEVATSVMNDFQNGTISAAEALAKIRESTQSVEQQEKRASDFATKNLQNRSEFGRGAALRNIGALGGLNPFMETSWARNARLGEESANEIKQTSQFEAERFKLEAPARQAAARAFAAAGMSSEDIAKQSTDNLKERKKEFTQTALTLSLRGDQAGSDAAKAAADQLQAEIEQIEKETTNLVKEVERSRKAFQAMNLGFQKSAAVSGALSVGMENLLASQELGYNSLDNSLRTLEAGVTSAAQGISDEAFKSALDDAASSLQSLGENEAAIGKFKENLTAINTAQKFFAAASEDTKKELINNLQRGVTQSGGTGNTREIFAKAVTEQLAGAGIGSEVRDRISDALANAEISGDDMNAILAGDMSVLDKVLKDLGDTTLNQVMGPLKDYAKYQSQLTDITKKRLELEDQVVNAQRGVLQAQLEAQEIIAKYGGPALTPEKKRQNILAQANLQAGGTGVDALRTGSAEELNARSQQARARLAEIADIKQQAQPEGADKSQVSGEAGAKLAAEEKRLQELAKSDYETTKQLIQLKEEELKLIQEKNRLEKSSIEALITGDIDKFFEQQAAVGATAAIALGNQSLMGAFGPQALGQAALDIERQKEAGVQTLYGQELGGAGGLAERGFAAAISSRGVSGGSALQMAQVAAGTTAEETAAMAEIRSLASTLPNYAETQLQTAQQDLAAANTQYQAAEMQLQAAKEQVDKNLKAGKENAEKGREVIAAEKAAAKSMGGLIYANRGIFVPRGTDTVPAMLTPGEFVVRRQAVQRGNNLQILQAMNRGKSGVSNNGDNAAIGMRNGGIVQYRQNGSNNPETGNVGFGLSSDVINKFSTALNQFNSDLSANIDKLNSTTFNIKLDTTNINVNLTGTSFIAKLREDLLQDLTKVVADKIRESGIGQDGKLKEQKTVLGK